MQNFTDEYFMKIALQQAKLAFEENEVPIGAVVVIENQIIAKAYNQVEKLQDATAHAEILALTSAMNKLGSKFLENAQIYVTVEPCLMCLGAIKWARIKRIVFGAYEEKFGFFKFEKVLNEKNFSLLDKNMEVKGGVLQEQAIELMQKFFKTKRKK